MLGTRPDIAFAVGRLSQFCSNPDQSHWDALTHLMRYLHTTKAYGIMMMANRDAAPLTHFTLTKHDVKASEITGFSDADFAADYDRLSVGGNLFFHFGNLVSWSSKKIALVATSTLEAEYAALSLAGRQAIWLQSLDGQLQMQNPDEYKTIQQYCDNTSAINVVKNPESHARTKHFDIHVHFVRQRAALGHIKVDYLSTKRMPADFLTKPLPRRAFEECRAACNITKLSD